MNVIQVNNKILERCKGCHSAKWVGVQCLYCKNNGIEEISEEEILKIAKQEQEEAINRKRKRGRPRKPRIKHAEPVKRCFVCRKKFSGLSVACSRICNVRKGSIVFDETGMVVRMSIAEAELLIQKQDEVNRKRALEARLEKLRNKQSK